MGKQLSRNRVSCNRICVFAVRKTYYEVLTAHILQPPAILTTFSLLRIFTPASTQLSVQNNSTLSNISLLTLSLSKLFIHAKSNKKHVYTKDDDLDI